MEFSRSSEIFWRQKLGAQTGSHHHGPKLTVFFCLVSAISLRLESGILQVFSYFCVGRQFPHPTPIRIWVGVMWADCRGWRPLSNCEQSLQTPILPEGAGRQRWIDFLHSADFCFGSKKWIQRMISASIHPSAGGGRLAWTEEQICTRSRFFFVDGTSEFLSYKYKDDQLNIMNSYGLQTPILPEGAGWIGWRNSSCRFCVRFPPLVQT